MRGGITKPLGKVENSVKPEKQKNTEKRGIESRGDMGQKLRQIGGTRNGNSTR